MVGTQPTVTVAGVHSVDEATFCWEYMTDTVAVLAVAAFATIYAAHSLPRQVVVAEGER
jgi:hypothetical protein